MRKLPTFAEVKPVYEPPVPIPLGYRVIVRPKSADAYVGSIALPARTKRAQKAIQTTGQLVAIGALAWSRTRDIALDTDPHRPVVGDWVVFRQYQGQKLYVRRNHDGPDVEGDDEPEGEYLLIMDDLDILTKVPEDMVPRFRHWV